ncbi:MAG: hypothetical protein V4695_00625 [Pseudomonadota bacterium]
MATTVTSNNDYLNKEARPSVSWGAIFAAVVVGLALQALLGMLGTALGASTIDPSKVEGSPSAAAFGIGAGIWWVVSSLISMFAAGWIAGHLSGTAHKSDTVLHGLATWALTTILVLYMLSSAAGSAFSGAANALGKVADVSAKGVAAVAPDMAAAAKDAAGEAGFSWDDIKSQARTLLAQTGKPALQPDAAANTVSNAAGAAAAGEQDIGAMLDKLFASGKDAASQVDREAVINVVMQRTGKNRADAEKQVAAWETSYQQSKQKYEEVKRQTEAKAREAADATAKAVAQAALLAFIASLLGALAAMFGAAKSGARRLLVMSSGRN